MVPKNILFDLGGVLLNIDFGKTAAAFTALGVENFDQYFTQVHSNPLFSQLEKGQIINNDFYDSVRKAASIMASNDEIDIAWNAMLFDFPPAVVNRLKELSKRYRLFLFSNTNAIHHTAFTTKFEKEFGFPLDSLFEKAWYSHLIGYRKPDVEAFRFVCNDASISPAETVFIDDTLPNVVGAEEAGLVGIHLKEMNILELLNKY